VSFVESPGRLDVRFVRCRVNDACEVGQRGELAEDGSITVVIERAQQDVFAADGSATRKIYPE